MIDALANKPLLEVDGGVNLRNIKSISSAGADVFVTGATVFSSSDYAKTIAEMKVAMSNI
jgi:ribulose-phosphate 3-epimerase